MARTVPFYLSLFIIYLSIIILNINGQKTSSGSKTKVVYAINCGGEEHTGLDGVHYEADPLQVGIASDFGRRYSIARVPPQDAVLYQTERYYTNTFIYDIPLSGDGDYVLVLKFSEVYFTSPGQKVFDVVLNEEHVVAENLDIFYKVGLGAAHDELITFNVKGSRLCLPVEAAPSARRCSEIYDNRVPVKFVKGERDNPKVNAIALFKGSLEDVPRLPPHPRMQAGQQATHDQWQESAEEEQPQAPPPRHVEDEGWDDTLDVPQVPQRPTHELKRRSVAASSPELSSGPAAADPYAGEEGSSLVVPLLVALALFLPAVLLLCRL